MPARVKLPPSRELVVRVPLGQTVVVRFEPEPPAPVDAPNGDLGGQPQGRERLPLQHWTPRLYDNLWLAETGRSRRSCHDHASRPPRSGLAQLERRDGRR
jgi:hypothetical protein